MLSRAVTTSVSAEFARSALKHSKCLRLINGPLTPPRRDPLSAALVVDSIHPSTGGLRMRSRVGALLRYSVVHSEEWAHCSQLESKRGRMTVSIIRPSCSKLLLIASAKSLTIILHLHEPCAASLVSNEFQRCCERRGLKGLVQCYL